MQKVSFSIPGAEYMQLRNCAVDVVLLMGELFGDTLRKKDASRHGERPFCVMCHQKARPFTDLRGVPSSDAP